MVYNVCLLVDVNVIFFFNRVTVTLVLFKQFTRFIIPQCLTVKCLMLVAFCLQSLQQFMSVHNSTSALSQNTGRIMNCNFTRRCVSLELHQKLLSLQSVSAVTLSQMTADLL